MSERFTTMIETLRERYDIIILDTVPYTVVADASIVNRHVDLTVYVMRDGKIDKHYLPELERMYADNKSRILQYCSPT